MDIDIREQFGFLLWCLLTKEAYSKAYLAIFTLKRFCKAVTDPPRPLP